MMKKRSWRETVEGYCNIWWPAREWSWYEGPYKQQWMGLMKYQSLLNPNLGGPCWPAGPPTVSPSTVALKTDGKWQYPARCLAPAQMGITIISQGRLLWTFHKPEGWVQHNSIENQMDPSLTTGEILSVTDRAGQTDGSVHIVHTIHIVHTLYTMYTQFNMF